MRKFQQTELTLLLRRHRIHVAVITETHLNNTVPDAQVFQTGYKLLRRDRIFSEVAKSKGGGTLIYVKDHLPCIVPNICVPAEIEACWCILRPSLPESIIVAGVYIPPDTSAGRRRVIADHITETIDKLRSLRPRARCVILGDFNGLFEAKSLVLQLDLQQIVTEPTRGSRVLDLILTDLNSQNAPCVIPPLGTSDHNTIVWVNSENQTTTYQYRITRPLKDSCIRQFGQWLCTQD